MRNSKVTTNFILAETDQNLKIEWIYYPPCRGARDSCGGVAGAGPALEPDDPAELEFIKAYDEQTGEEVELTESEQDTAREKAWEEMSEQDDCPEPLDDDREFEKEHLNYFLETSY